MRAMITWTNEECVVKGRKTVVWLSGDYEIVEDRPNTRFAFCVYFHGDPIMIAPRICKRFSSVDAAMKWVEELH